MGTQVAVEVRNRLANTLKHLVNRIAGGTMQAIDIAEYFLRLAEIEEDLISNMKLQKLLYYAQGFSLAILDRPIIDESIENWIHGPVFPDVYRAYNEHGSGALSPNPDHKLPKIDEETESLLREVYSIYGQFSAGVLRNMTHREPPWKDTSPFDEISQAVMKEFFLTRITDA